MPERSSKLLLHAAASGAAKDVKKLLRRAPTESAVIMNALCAAVVNDHAAVSHLRLQTRLPDNAVAIHTTVVSSARSILLGRRWYRCSSPTAAHTQTRILRTGVRCCIQQRPKAPHESRRRSSSTVRESTSRAVLAPRPSLSRASVATPSLPRCRPQLSQTMGLAARSMLGSSLLVANASTVCRVRARPTQVLLAGGADAARADVTGATPLYVACQNGKLGAVEALLRCRSPDAVGLNAAKATGATPLYVACQKGEAPIVSHLLSARAVVDQPCADPGRGM